MMRLLDALISLMLVTFDEERTCMLLLLVKIEFKLLLELFTAKLLIELTAVLLLILGNFIEVVPSLFVAELGAI